MNYQELAKEARREVLTLIHKAQTSHVASNFSVIDIATVLYAKLKPEDRVVWSKGWAAATIYYFLYKQGKITREQLDSFPNAPFLGLAETTVPGVEVNGGSVGHGLSVACGMALAKKRSREPGTVYCIMSDGELNEGATWEAAMMAGHHKLDNLVAIIDRNGWQAMGRTEDVADFNEYEVFRGFKWGVVAVDGHNYDDLGWGLHFVSQTNSPRVVLCETVKGKGISFMENLLTFHYKHVSDEDYQRAMLELQ